MEQCDFLQALAVEAVEHLYFVFVYQIQRQNLMVSGILLWALEALMDIKETEAAVIVLDFLLLIHKLLVIRLNQITIFMVAMAAAEVALMGQAAALAAVILHLLPPVKLPILLRDFYKDARDKQAADQVQQDRRKKLLLGMLHVTKH